MYSLMFWGLAFGAVCVMVGHKLVGYGKTLMIFSSIGAIASMIFAYYPHVSFKLMLVSSFCIGLSAIMQNVFYGIIADKYHGSSKIYMYTSLCMSCSVFFGSFVSKWINGLLIDWSWSYTPIIEHGVRIYNVHNVFKNNSTIKL